MAYPSSQPPISKIQMNLEIGAGKQTTTIVGEKHKDVLIDDKALNNVRGALYIAKCEECELTFTGTCNKILVDSCKNVRLTLNGRVLTNVLEICKSENLTLIINTRISTLQADMCRKVRIEFSQQELFKQLVWASVDGLTLSFVDGPKILPFETSFAQMKEKFSDLSETDQFCVRFVGGALLQERVLRLGGGYPSTEREKRFFEAEVKKRDEHMRQQAERMFSVGPKFGNNKQSVTSGAAAKAAAETSTTAAAAMSTPNTLTILALGDSLTEGLVSWGEPFQPYTKYLPEMLSSSLASGWSIDVCNLGLCGEKSDEIMRRAPYGGKWDIVMLLAGTNDLFGREVDAIWTNLLEMYTAFEQANTVVVAVTAPRARIKIQPAWLPERREKLNDRIRVWVNEKRDRRVLVDLFAGMKTDDAHLWAADGLHFSAAGYKHFGSLVAAALTSSVISGSKPWQKQASS